MDPERLPDEIVGERTTLRKHRPELAARMFECVDRDRERLGRFLPWVPIVLSVRDEEGFIRRSLEAWERGTRFEYGIFENTSQAYIGNLGVFAVSWEHRSCEIGYWLLGDFEGRGLMQATVGALEGAVFKAGFHRIMIRCDTRNERSANIPRKRGYGHEGTSRQDTYEDGAFYDTLVFSKLGPG